MATLTPYVAPATYLTAPSITAEALSVSNAESNANLALRDNELNLGLAAELAARNAAILTRAPTVHTHTADQLSDSTALGRSVVTAATAAAIRTAADAASNDSVEMRREEHPGHFPNNYRIWTAGVLSDVPAEFLATSDDGPVVRMTGDAELVSLRRHPVEMRRVYECRFVIEREVDTPDPANDAVVVGVRWYDQVGTALGGSNATTVVENYTSLYRADGAQEITVLFSHLAGDYEPIPTSARMARLFTRRYGNAGADDVQVMQWRDVSVVYSPDVSEFGNRLTNIEGLHLESRMIEVENATLGSRTGWYPTLSDAESDTPLVTFQIVYLQRIYSDGPVVNEPWKRAVGEPTHAVKYQDAGGSWWEWAGDRLKPTSWKCRPGTTYDSTMAFREVLAFGAARGMPVFDDGFVYLLNGAMTNGSVLPFESGWKLIGAKGRSKFVVGEDVDLTARIVGNANVPTVRNARVDTGLLLKDWIIDGAAREYPAYLQDPDTGEAITDPENDPRRNLDGDGNPLFFIRGTLVQWIGAIDCVLDGVKGINHQSISLSMAGCLRGRMIDCEGEDYGKIDDISSFLHVVDWGRRDFIYNCSNASPAILTVASGPTGSPPATYAVGSQVWIEGLADHGVADGIYTVQSHASNPARIALTGTNSSAGRSFTEEDIGKAIVGAAYFTAGIAGEIRNPNIHDGNRIGITFAEWNQPDTYSFIIDPHIDDVGEGGIHANAARNLKIRGGSISRVRLTDIVANGIEAAYTVDLDIDGISISDIDTCNIKFNGGIRPSVKNCRLARPNWHPGLLLPYNWLSENFGTESKAGDPLSAAETCAVGYVNLGLFPFRDWDFQNNILIDGRVPAKASGGFLGGQSGGYTGRCFGGRIANNDLTAFGRRSPIQTITTGATTTLTTQGGLRHGLEVGDTAYIFGVIGVQVAVDGPSLIPDGAYTVTAVNTARTSITIAVNTSTATRAFVRWAGAVIGTIPENRLWGTLQSTAIVPSTITLRGNRGHASESVIALPPIYISPGGTGTRKIYCGYCPSMVEIFAQTSTTGRLIQSNAVFNRFGYNNPDNTLGNGLSAAINGLASASGHVAEFTAFTNEAVFLSNGSGGADLRAEFAGWLVDGFNLNVTTAAVGAALIIKVHP